MEEEIAAEMLRAGMNTRAEFIAYVREKFFKEYDKEVVFGDKYKSSHQVQMFCAGCDFEIRGRKSVGNKSDGLFHLVEKPCQLVHKKIVKGVEYPCDSSFLTHKKREAKEKISHSSIESEGLQAEVWPALALASIIFLTSPC